MKSPDWSAVAKQRMGELDLRQEDLCQALGVKTRGAVGHYLSGRRQPDPSQMLALSKKLRITIGELFGDRPLPHSSPEVEQPSYYLIDPDLIESILVALEEREQRIGGPLSKRVKAEKIAKYLTQAISTRQKHDRARIDSIVAQVVQEDSP